MGRDLESTERLLKDERGVGGGEASSESQYSRQRHQPPSSLLKWLLVVALLAVPTAFYGGWKASDIYRHRIDYRTIPRVRIDTVAKEFENNHEFMKPPPDDHSEEPIWDALLPKGFGYVNHAKDPEVTEISVVSAWHQLHCVYLIRRAYYADPSNNATALNAFDNGVERDEHIAHCFDYLRQGVMCSADSTIEALSQHDNKPGQGVPRQCGDYEGLRTWAEKYRVLDRQSFILPKDQWDIPSN